MKNRTPKYNGTQKAILVGFFAVVAVSIFLTVFLLGKAFFKTRDAGEDELPRTLTEVLPDVGGTISSVLPENTDETSGETEVETDETTPEKDPRILEVQSEEWNLLLVNPWNPIARDYEPTLLELSNGQSIDRRIYDDLQAMMDDARAEGLHPIICSAYRTNDRQRELFKNQVDKYISAGMTESEAETEASKWVAVPGTSEHQTGLAVDIVALDYQLLDEGQEDTAEQKWLMENSYKYGFILRYPTDKSDVTGIHYEPWHYRYVGKDVAAEIYSAGICLEEYLIK